MRSITLKLSLCSALLLLSSQANPPRDDGPIKDLSRPAQTHPPAAPIPVIKTVPVRVIRPPATHEDHIRTPERSGLAPPDPSKTAASESVGAGVDAQLDRTLKGDRERWPEKPADAVIEKPAVIEEPVVIEKPVIIEEPVVAEKLAVIEKPAAVPEKPACPDVKYHQVSRERPTTTKSIPILIKKGTSSSFDEKVTQAVELI